MGSVAWRCSLCMRCEGVRQVVQMTKNVQKEANKVAKSGTVTRIEYCYLAYLAVMLFARGIGLYEGTTIYTVTLLTGLFLFALKIMMTDHTVYEYLWMGAFLLLSLIIYAGTGEKGFLVYMTMMLGLKNVSMRTKQQSRLLHISIVCRQMMESIQAILTGRMYFLQRLSRWRLRTLK